MLLGPLPTPGVAYLTRAQRAQLGVVISASHNPYPDNGIKFFSAQGTKLPMMHGKKPSKRPCKSPPVGHRSRTGQSRSVWTMRQAATLNFAKARLPVTCHLHGLKIVVDAAHGAAYHIAPKVFHELGPKSSAIGCQPNGLNINDHVGATHPEALALAVRANHADLRHRPRW